MKDLFETPEMLPKKIQTLINKFEPQFEIGDKYKACAELLKVLSKNGYTFEYGLDGSPFNLQKAIKWDEVRKGSTVILLEDKEFPSFGGTKDLIKAGTYYVCGFWANVVGLSKTKDSLNDFVFSADLLTEFEGII